VHDALGGFAFVSAVFAFVESKLWDDLKADGSDRRRGERRAPRIPG